MKSDILREKKSNYGQLEGGMDLVPPGYATAYMYITYEYYIYLGTNSNNYPTSSAR